MTTILVVDDSRVMRQIVTRALRQAGYDHVDIVEAEDGLDGMSKVVQCEPDVVLSDWNMPQMSGLEFLQALRSRGDGRPFGFVTSESSEPMREAATQAGASFLIGKPFSPEDVQAALDPVLS
ncbi:response regulator [Lapillicoccus jejuensis]|uniref:Two-component system chemotaxis response regulator CheY n=1 Tax=Lapillicoccus jejuensis TaxID=402171 RepID=A0A542E197_9MICO|nr:response regulator [Lapillicoccus jejuensis]TQJ09120.1 two-component system chemotaxis response regulator CheY [Lapillicoccus jejuensis]